MRFFSFVLLAASAFIAPTVDAAPANGGKAAAVPSPTIAINGDIEKPLSLSRAQMERLAPAQTVRATHKGKLFQARGVALSRLLEAAKPRVPADAKNAQARFVVLARARDGYAVAFSWPELSSDVGGKAAYLVWEANGKPLSGRDGPFRLVVPSDKKPMRWIYGLASLMVVDLAKSRP